ncbi:hypothetical protein ABZV87_00155 [Streptomyces tendae]|uniref:hypothetical protein n=1 Tax=Streptomyces tendae TaxID=1932 RepID=UPI0033BBE82E
MPAARGRRPAAVVALTVHALLVGTALTGGAGYGLYYMWTWMHDAPPGENRAIGGWVFLFIFTIGLAMGVAVLRSGCRMALGRPRSSAGAVMVYFPLFGLTCLALGRGLLAWDPDSDDWWMQLQGFGIAFAILLPGLVLDGRPSAHAYFGYPPRRQGRPRTGR